MVGVRLTGASSAQPVSFCQRPSARTGGPAITLFESWNVNGGPAAIQSQYSHEILCRKLTVRDKNGRNYRAGRCPIRTGDPETLRASPAMLSTAWRSG